MTSVTRKQCWSSFGLALGMLLFSGWSMAADRPKAAQPEPVPVEMFAAIQSGQIGVRLIPKDATECRVLIENKTDRPLSVKLPGAFAGVPVLAQFGGVGRGGNVGRGGGGGFGNSSTSQSFGGGMGGGGGFGMGGGMGGGMFNVAPEKVGQLRVATVCLEHGKADPNPRVKYEIRPIEQYTDKPAVQELCRMLGAGQISQRVAQVAAWHLENNMSWQELSSKQIRHLNGMRELYFSPDEVRAGMAAVSTAKQLAADHREQSSPAKSSASASENP